MDEKLSPCATQLEEEIGTESLKQIQTSKGRETSSYRQGLENRKEEEEEKLDCATSVEQSSNNCTTRPTFSDPNKPIDKGDALSSTNPTMNDTDQKRVSRRDEHEQRKLLMHSSGQDLQEGEQTHTTQNSNLDDEDIVIFPTQVKVCQFNVSYIPTVIQYKKVNRFCKGSLRIYNVI